MCSKLSHLCCSKEHWSTEGPQELRAGRCLGPPGAVRGYPQQWQVRLVTLGPSDQLRHALSPYTAMQVLERVLTESSWEVAGWSKQWQDYSKHVTPMVWSHCKQAAKLAATRDQDETLQFIWLHKQPPDIARFSRPCTLGRNVCGSSYHCHPLSAPNTAIRINF